MYYAACKSDECDVMMNIKKRRWNDENENENEENEMMIVINETC